MKIQFLKLTVSFVAFGFTGCASPIADQQDVEGWSNPDVLASDSTDLLCEQASTHVAQCFALDRDAATDGCDRRVASWALARDCEQLAADLPGSTSRDDASLIRTRGISPSAKSWASEFRCSLGFTQYCDVPRCGSVDDFGAETCSELARIDGCGACYFYTCREQELGLNCGPEGYFEAYGQKYCQLFTDWTYRRLSPAGQAWIEAVRGCLIDYVAQEIHDTMTCNEVKEAAFASHPDCYVSTGFCSLPPTDWATVVATIAPWDNDIRQVVATGVGCLSSWRS